MYLLPYYYSIPRDICRHSKQHTGVEKLLSWRKDYEDSYGEQRIRRADATAITGGQQHEATSQNGQMIRELEIGLSTIYGSVRRASSFM